ncbi:unnamed protein product [Anisakis simplex]|nr:unnamed protein product [Anisakis simplex]
MGASLPKRSLMTPLSVDVRDSRSGSPELVPNGVSLPLSSRSASNHSSCFSSPTPVPPHHQKRSRNCSTSQLLSPTRLNGSLLKLNGVRKGSAE